MSKRRRDLFRRNKKDSANDEQEDFSMEWLPDPDDVEVEDLDSLRESEAVRPLNITPEEERFPPIDVDVRPVPLALGHQSQKSKAKVVYEPVKWGSNILALLFLLATIGLIAVIILIWQNPYSQLNPFPPPTPFIEVTATPGPMVPAEPTAAPTVPVVESAYDFSLANDVIYTTNGNDQGCEWTSIVGTVQDTNGDAVDGYRVSIDDGINEQVVFTGSTPRLGPGGWELVLGQTLINGQYAVQLTNTAGEAMSEPLLVDMVGDCASNVAIINWRQN
ncbi:MAG: hypothetical protein KC546_01525 [Anaerolineae bacterium]|nr:hypothetical protein [Anaerolineae bacterium]MCA9895827.1 hypothetical protein [Anaerolineae bacterium]